MTNDRPLYIYFGHHKCASTWIEEICANVCYDLGLTFRIVYEAKDVGYDLKSFVERERVDFLAIANADYQYVQELENFVGFHVVRDPRDIIVSAYFSHLSTHQTEGWPELVSYREKLQSLSKEEGLYEEIEFRSAQFKAMAAWPEKLENVVEMRMEDMTMHSYQDFLYLFSCMGLIDDGDYTPLSRFRFLWSKILRKIEPMLGLKLPFCPEALPAERLLGIVWEHDFSKKSGGRKQGEEDTKSHYRKGVHGDWENHLDEGHVAEINKKYQRLIEKYNY